MSSMLTAERRGGDLAALAAGEVVDVLVVGGGVTGVGVALDAAARGLSVALIERTDLAAGTSRWSSKLAHGGLRYIAAGQPRVAWESIVERNRLVTAIAPHLARPMEFVIVQLPDTPRGLRTATRLAFGFADVMRAVARTPAFLPPTRWVGAQEARRVAPYLGRHVRGAVVHVDGALEDDARLVVALARTAASYGARVVTHCAAVDVARDGARVRDEMTGEEHEVRARTVVVAAGVWSGGLAADVPLQPSKGAHLLLRAAALGNPTVAVNVAVPGSLTRTVFAVPRPDGNVLLGLTDDAVDAVEDVPQVTDADERFLLETFSRALETPLTREDVVGRFAGLRPLLGHADGASAADLSRRHALLDRDGVLVLVGGKLTTYRRMAQDAVDRVADRLGRHVASGTATLPLVGAVGAADGAGDGVPVRLVRRFGAEAAAVAAAGSSEPVAPGVPALRCEVEWAVAAEGAVTREDVERRLRLDLVPAWREAAAPALDEAVSPR